MDKLINFNTSMGVGLLPARLSVCTIRVGMNAHPTIAANDEFIRNPDRYRVP
jgi:hypothetical protein